MLMNVKWTKAAVRGTVGTPLEASPASVLRAVDWGQMARHVMVRWTSVYTSMHKHAAQPRPPIMLCEWENSLSQV